jgi:hypothetical protein
MHYDMEDLLEQANEIQETLGRSYAVPDEIDEADLEAGMLGRFSKHSLLSAHTQLNLELDALALEEEEEGPSYLADLNKVPDFIDEAPVELGEVRTPTTSSFLHCQTDPDPFIFFVADTRATGGCQIDGLNAHEYIMERFLYVWYIVLLVSNLDKYHHGYHSTDNRHEFKMVNHISALHPCLQTSRRSFWSPQLWQY